jgi:hypothetical protein
VPERLAHRGPQRQCARRGLHALAAAHEQVVAHHLAQAAQRVADGRLGERQLLGRAREIALGHHFVEHAQQVQVQGAEVDRCHAAIITDVNDGDSTYKVE